MSSRSLTIAKYATGIFLSFTIFAGVSFLVDPDLPWHRAVGEHILETGTLPHFDEYTYTMPGFPWVDHEWAVETFFSLLYSHGMSLVAILFFTMLGATPFLYWICRARYLGDLWFILFCSLPAFGIFGVRPQMFSFFLFFLLFLLLERRFSAPEKLSRVQIFQMEAGILILFFVWANLHAGFPSGLVLLSIYLFSDVVTHRKTPKIFQRILRGGIFLALAILIPILNPYGVGLYREIFTVMTSANTKEYVFEWWPWYATTFDTDGKINYLNAGIFLQAFYAFFFLSFFKKYPLRILISTLVFLILYNKSVKMAPLFIVTLLPFFSLGLQYLREKLGEEKLRAFLNRENIRRYTAPKVAVALGAFLILFVVSSLWKMLLDIETKSIKIPYGALSFLKEESQKGEKIILWNEYSYGGFLIEQVPEVKVFIDGRMPHWEYTNGDSAMQEFATIAYSENKKKIGDVLNQRKVNTMFFSKEMLARKPILKEYLAEKQWEVSYEDDIAIIYKKETPE